jgi:hypothetical protein
VKHFFVRQHGFEVFLCVPAARPWQSRSRFKRKCE